MPTYVYQTVPRESGAPPSSFEVKQSMRDLPLTVHPETGEPVRRVILGGLGILRGGKSVKPAPKPAGGGCCGGCGCH